MGITDFLSTLVKLIYKAGRATEPLSLGYCMNYMSECTESPFDYVWDIVSNKQILLWMILTFCKNINKWCFWLSFGLIVFCLARMPRSFPIARMEGDLIDGDSFPLTNGGPLP